MVNLRGRLVLINSQQRSGAIGFLGHSTGADLGWVSSGLVSELTWQIFFEETSYCFLLFQ